MALWICKILTNICLFGYFEIARISGFSSDFQNNSGFLKWIMDVYYKKASFESESATTHWTVGRLNTIQLSNGFIVCGTYIILDS